MKKIFVLIISILLLTFTLTGCGATELKLGGRYWQENPAGFENLNETYRYNVSVTNNDGSNKFIIDEGKYEVHLVANSENDYVYETSLKITGKYVIDGKDYPVNDEITTKTTYSGLFQKFKPYKTEKTVKNSTVFLGDSLSTTVVSCSYNYTINYDEKDATATFNVIKDEHNILKSIDSEVKYSKYNKNAYIDNELILFVPRAFDIADNFSQDFSTIDVITKSLKKCKYFVGNDNKVSVQKINGIDCNKLYFGIDDTFSGPSIEAYYEVGGTHRLMKVKQALNNGLGNLEYTYYNVE